MPSIEQVLTPGTGIGVEFVNIRGDKVTGQSKIYSYEGIYMVLEAPDPMDILNNLTLNQNMAIICKYEDEPEDFVFFVKFIKAKNADPPLIMVSKPNNFNLGRKAFRCEVNLPFGYYNSKSVFKEGMVLNLSSTGLFASIEPDQFLQLGMVISIKLQFPTVTSPLMIMGKIVRIESIGKQSRIALQFSCLPNGIRDSIAKFISGAQSSTAQEVQQRK